MKYGKLTNGKKTYSSIFLENMDDAISFCELNSQVKAKQSSDFWFSFKSQTFRGTMMSYAQHEIESENSMAYCMALKCDYSPEPITLVKYCQIADGLIDDMNRTIKSMVSSGSIIKVSERLTYHPIQPNEIHQYENVTDITNEQMRNFVISGDINHELEIKSSTVIIENGRCEPNGLVEKCIKAGLSANKEDVQLISKFKRNTLLYSDNDFFALFNRGVKYAGLENILIETTGQDERQIDGMKRLIESVMSMRKSRKLNVYVSAYEWVIEKDLFKTEAPNIKIIYVKK